MNANGEFLEYLDEEHALCVRCTWTEYGDPVRVSLWWPIWRGSRANAECYALGERLSGREGRYGYADYLKLPPNAQRTVFLLENGGKTEAIKVLKGAGAAAEGAGVGSVRH